MRSRGAARRDCLQLESCARQLSRQDALLHSSIFTICLHPVSLRISVIRCVPSPQETWQGYHHGDSMSFRDLLLLGFFYKDVRPVGERQELLTSLSPCQASCLTGKTYCTLWSKSVIEHQGCKLWRLLPSFM
ncbi:hypothetical protein EYF80_017100 [Liparis tanakae]|uniref:Uncharacterized protein n=1 Tax=Liparis tanakae TaxID=230148 RepID=A0A4Z2I4F6_9TELE|nr:hypothetical protein EYF80_017100 [Liparis tanakae]